MDRGDVERWIDGYRDAWESNDPKAIGSLFAADATYSPTPFEEVWKGRDEIVRRWIERKDDPGSYDFRYEVIAIEDPVAVVRGWTRYHTTEGEYSNLWVIRFDSDGRCASFQEWWMQRPVAGG